MPDLVKHIHCVTAAELLDGLSLRGTYLGGARTFRDWAFRGHGQSSYQLVPAALRPNAIECVAHLGQVPMQFMGSLDSQAGQVLAEMMLLRHFFMVADESGLTIPGDSPLFRQHLAETHCWLQDCVKNGGATSVLSWPEDEYIPLMALA